MYNPRCVQVPKNTSANHSYQPIVPIGDTARHRHHDRLSIHIPSVLVSVISKRAISNQMPFVPPNQLCITDDMAHKIGLSEMRTNTHPISSLSLHSLDPAGLSASSTFVRTHKSHLPAKLREELTSQLG